MATAARPEQGDPHAPYTVYKMDISYFSGKLEAYLRYKGVPYEPVEADAACLDRVIFRHTGVKKVPAVRSADGLWLFDSTPTIAWFEDQYPRAPVLPADPALAFIAALIEDYGDEWLWRPAMWWRWEPMASRLALGRRIADNVALPLVPRAWFAWFFAHRQRHTWLWGDGVNRANAAAVRDLYPQELDLLQSVLREQPYLLGSHPSVADFGYFASMFRHFGNDPDAAELMRRRAPEVYEWLARLWNESAERLGPKPAWKWPDADSFAPLWQRIVGDYLPYLRQNALAFAQRRRRFDFQGRSQQYPGTATHHYRVWCRQELQRRYQALEADEQERVDAVFAPAGGLAELLADGMIDAGMDEQFALPKAAGHYKPSLRVALLGQPRN